MTTYTVSKGKGGVFGAEGLGQCKQRTWFSYDADATLADGRPLAFRRTNWNRVHLAETPTSSGQAHTIGEFDKTSWLREAGIVRWDGVDHDFGTQSGWKGTFALSRHGEELALIKVSGWKQDIEITVRDTATTEPPAGLLLFCAWISLLTVRDRSGAAAG